MINNIKTSLYVLTSLPLDERNGAGMRAVIPQILALPFSQIISLSLAQAIPTAPHRQIRYEFLGFRGKGLGGYLKILCLGLRLFANSTHHPRRHATYLSVPDSMFDVIFALVASFLGRRVVVWIMDDFVSESRGLKPHLLKFFFKTLYRRAAGRIVVSPWMARVYEKRFRKKADLIAGRSTTFLLPPKKINDLTPGRPVKLIYVGSFQAYDLKPLEELAQVIHDRFAGRIELHAFGMRGPSKGSPLEFHYQGAIEQEGEALTRFIAQYDYAILPYAFEPTLTSLVNLSFPSKVVDYVSAALPVLIYGPQDLPQISALTDETLGLSLSKSEPEAIVHFLNSLLNVTPEEYAAFSANAHGFAEKFLFAPEPLARILMPTKSSCVND